MVEFKDVYITAKDGKIQWPILDIERITFDKTSLTGIQFKEAVQMWMNRADLMEKIRGLETEISEVKRYVEQSYFERKQSAAVARFVSSAQVCEILKMQDRIKGPEHRLGLAQDRIAEIHPSGCVPPVRGKPKSQLKTDRGKKVK